MVAGGGGLERGVKGSAVTGPGFYYKKEMGKLLKIAFIDKAQSEPYNFGAVFANLREKLSRTRNALREKLDGLFQSGKARDKVLDELAEALILSDAGVTTTEKIISDLKKITRKEDGPDRIESALKEELVRLLGSAPSGLSLGSGPSVIMFVGVNGGGKTTSVAKLANHLLSRRKKVMVAAADTFRAAAQEQLTIWGDRLGIPVVRGQYGADPASVAFDAVQSLKARGWDVLLVDTAGRIHTDVNLMSELEKVRRIISREVPGAPQEILLVLDASIGQNALVQARQFLKFSGITGIFLTKLDGTAKGGSVIAIADELRLPIKFVGVGESEGDMLEFSPAEFVDALLA